MKRIVISDLHIGSKYYKADTLISFLKSAEYDELVLAGDIVDLIKVPVFSEKAIEIFEAIDYTKSIVYVVGNHDISLDGFIGKNLFNIRFTDCYEFTDNDVKFRIRHGDEYDNSFILKNHMCVTIFSLVHHAFEELFSIDITSWWSNLNIRKRKLNHIWDILKWNNDVDVFIMGHLHIPEKIAWTNQFGVTKTYVNIGDWISSETYVSIENGDIKLTKYVG